MTRGMVRARALAIAVTAVGGWAWALLALAKTALNSVDAVRAPGPATPDAVLVALAAAAATALLAWLGVATLASLPTAFAETRRRRAPVAAEAHRRVGLLTPALRREADLALAVPGAAVVRAATPHPPRPQPTAPVSPWLLLSPPSLRRWVAGLVVAAVLGISAAQTAAASDLAPGRDLSPAWGDTTSTAPADPLTPGWGDAAPARPTGAVAPAPSVDTSGPARSATERTPSPAAVTADPAEDLLTPGWAPPAPPVVKPQVALPGPTLRPTAALDEKTVVRRGDSLWDIAARHLGPGAGDAEVAAEWPRWWVQNRGVIGPDPDRLQPGQQLTAPP